MQPTVILLNPDLTYAAPPQMLQGFSGRTYAMSRWNAAYHCHAVEMSLADYEKCWQDIQKAIHLQMRRWFPRFIVPERPAAVVEYENGYQLGAEGAELPAEVSGAMRAGWEAGGGISLNLNLDPNLTLPEKAKKAEEGESKIKSKNKIQSATRRQTSRTA